MRDGCFASFSPARRPARFPSQGGCPGLLRGYDHLERGRWNFAQSVLVDVDALDDVAVLGAVHDLVLRVLVSLALCRVRVNVSIVFISSL